MTAAAVEETTYTLSPCNDRLVVRLCPTQTESPGGIVLPGGSQEVPQYADVVVSGPGKFWPELMSRVRTTDGGTETIPSHLQPRHPMSCYAGDRVLINKYAGTPIELNGEKLTILRDEDVLAVVTTAR